LKSSNRRLHILIKYRAAKCGIFIVKNAYVIDRSTTTRAIIRTGHESTGGEPFY